MHLAVKRTGVFLLAIAGLVSCSDIRGGLETVAMAARARCEAERDRIIEGRLANTSVDATRHRAALLAAIGEQLVQTCLDKDD